MIVECPFRGWRWGPDGTNRHIPYQPDSPDRALWLAKQDTKPYMAQRRWVTQFYEVPPRENAVPTS